LFSSGDIRRCFRVARSPLCSCGGIRVSVVATFAGVFLLLLLLMLVLLPLFCCGHNRRRPLLHCHFYV